jgi:hypothetical protein
MNFIIMAMCLSQGEYKDTNYKIERHGLIQGGAAVMRMSDEGDVYAIGYNARVKVPFGQKTFKGTKVIEREYLTEEFLKNNNKFESDGITFTKISNTEFSFKGDDVKGKMKVAYDGCDPVEIVRVEALGQGQKIVLVK